MRYRKGQLTRPGYDGRILRLWRVLFEGKSVTLWAKTSVRAKGRLGAITRRPWEDIGFERVSGETKGGRYSIFDPSGGEHRCDCVVEAFNVLRENWIDSGEAWTIADNEKPRLRLVKEVSA